MLDLNVEIVSSDSSSCGDTRVLVMAVDEEEEGEEVEEVEEKEKNLPGVPVGEEGEDEEDDEEQSVGTSDSSSVVNADKSPANGGEENTSRAAAAAFAFDVFKEDKDESSSSPSGLITRQLFPVHSGGAAELGLGQLTTAAAPRTQWLNLSFTRDSGVESGGPLLAGKLGKSQPEKQQQVRKSRRGPRSRSSQYRGVTFYRRTGRWESHIWDCGKQVYLGGFDTAYAAARAYDRAAIKFRGVDADINFSISDYEEDMKQMGNLTKEEFVHILRKRSTSFPRPSSKYRGLAPQKCGRWDARIGRFLGAHDSTVIQYNGQRSVANLEHSGYEGEIVLEATTEGSGSHDLDLNLGMAPPSGDPKKIKVAGDYQLPRAKLAMVDSSNVSALNKRLPVWPAAYPFLLPTSEGRAMERRRAEAPTSSNIGGQISNNINYGGTSASPLMISGSAASSGFPSSLSSNTPSTHHLYKVSAVPQNPISQLHLSKHSSISVNPFPFFTLGHKGGTRDQKLVNRKAQ